MHHPAQFVSISCGGGFSCGLSTNGTVQCWGSQQEKYRQIQSEFRRHHLTSISCGGAHACGLGVGKVICKGCNSSGQVKVLDKEEEYSYSELSLGVDHTCGQRKSIGSVICWGGGFWEAHNNITQKLSFIKLASGNGFSCGIISAELSVACRGPDWPGSDYQLMPFDSTILPGLCVLNISECNFCGVLPNSENLCAAPLVICNPCIHDDISRKPLTRGLLAFEIAGFIGATSGIFTIFFIV